MIIKVNYTVSDIYMSTSVSPVYIKVVYSGTSGGSGTVTSVGLTMPSAFSVANSPITSSGTLAVTASGTASQYIRGDGQLATLPSNGSGGSSIAYYLNGSVNQGTIGGSVYYEMNKTPIIGAGTDFSLAGNGLISQFITDVADPNRLEIPAGNWTFEMYMSASSSGGNPKFYVELLKYDGTTFTSIASSSATPVAITSGTTIDLYVTALAIPQTSLLATDRLALRVYIVNSSGGRTITLHTENSHLCEVITNFPGDNIYTANGTLTSARTLTQGGYNLDLVGSIYTNRFSSAGRLLIGNGAESTYPLDVNGSARITSNLFLNPSSYITASDDLGGNRPRITFGTTGIFYNNWTFVPNTSGGIVVANAYQTISSTTAIFEIASNTRGFLPPRMTSAERTGITSPATGLLVYQTDGTEGLYEKTASAWRIINGGGTGFVPYTGATGDVNLGTHRILAQNATIASSGSGDTFTLNHTSGSGIGLNITKGGNGEGLYVNKTSGSGNAATIIGTLNATNLVKSGGTSAQLLAADGSVVTAGTNITISGGTISASGGGGSMAIGGAITSATAGSVLFAGTSGVLQQDNANLFWDDTNNRLGIGTASPTNVLEIIKNQNSDISLRVINTTSGVNAEANINVVSDSGSGFFLLGKKSSTNSGYKTVLARDAYFYNSTNGGDISFLNDFVSGKIKWAVGGVTTPQMTLTAAGRLLLGTTSESTYIFDSVGNARITGDALITGVLAETITTNRQTSSYTFALADRGKLVEMNVAAANNLSVPLNSNVPFPIGTKIDVTQYGAGQTTILATVGVTIRTANGWTKLNAQYAAATLIKIGTDEWYLFGNLNA